MKTLLGVLIAVVFPALTFAQATDATLRVTVCECIACPWIVKLRALPALSCAAVITATCGSG